MKRIQSAAGILKRFEMYMRLLALRLPAAALFAMAGPTNAATYSLPSAIGTGIFSACSFTSGTTYTCTGNIVVGNNDSLNFGTDMTLRITGNFTMGNEGSINDNGKAVTISTDRDINIGNSLSSSVNFRADGNFTAGNGATITGNIQADGNISFGNNATVTGDSEADGNVSFGNNTNITGDVHAGGNLSVGKGTINGNCTYASTNYICSGGSTAASFTVVPSTDTASTCSVAGGTPAAPWITITAKSGTGGSGSTVTSYTGAVTISGIGSGVLSVKTGNGTLSGSTYSFVSADNGVAELYITDPTAESVVPSATAGTISGTSGSAITFSDNVLVISDVDLGKNHQPVVGRPHALNAAVWSKDQIKGNCWINTTINNPSVAAEMWITPTPALHPSGATLPRVSTSNTCAAAVELPSSPDSTNINLAFNSGETAFYLCTSDVGQYSVNINAAALPGSAKETTASNTLTIVPFAIAVSNISNETTVNPGTVTSTGDIFATAGSAFRATVAAFRWNGDADLNGDGFPDSGVTWPDATNKGIVPRYAQTIKLAAATPIPAGGAIESDWKIGVISVSGGSTTVDIVTSPLSYPEVGSFTLTATPEEKYLGSADLSGRVLIYATAGTLQSNVVGRFTPNHFTTTVTHGCAAGNFTYAGQSTAAGASLTTGQPFTVTVTARNLAGAVTQNYAGSYAKPITLSLLTPPDSGATLSPVNATFTSGVAPISETLAVQPWTASFSSAIRATDSDDISSSGQNEGSTNFRIGRVRLMHASGSERLNLPMPMRVEYWANATQGWMRNTDDRCTGDASPVTLEIERVTLSAEAFAAVCAFDSERPGASGIGCAETGPPTMQFLEGGVADFAGNFNLNFRALTQANTGTANNTGSIIVRATVPTWLQYKWTSPAYGNPSARATFGQVRNNSNVIYRREMY